MKDLTPSAFEEHIGQMFTIDNPNDELPPHNLTIVSVNVLMETEDDRRNAFAVTFAGPAMIGPDGEPVLQGAFTFQGGPLDGQDVFISANGYDGNSVEDFEYEAIFA